VQLDSFTVLVFMSAALTFLGCALLYFWNRDRRSNWLLWWSIPFIAGGLSALSYARPDWDTDFLSIGPGNAARMMALAALWQGARVFEGRKPLYLVMALIPCVWLGVCMIPTFIEDMSARIIVVSIANGAFCSLAGWELWRGRAEMLPSRTPAIVVYLSFAVVMAVRIVGVEVLPFPMGSRPLDPWWMGGFNLVVFIHAFFLGLLLIALTKERLELEQRNIALVDPLTGLMNRRAFMGQVERNALRQGLGEESTALLVLDLDHFKSINDRYGHDVGDRVLASFAAVASANVRPTDLLYRLGGEEFCFVLPDTDVQSALRVAERVRKAFASHAYVAAGGEVIAATVSVGIATADHAGFDLEVLLAAGDAALYEAKSRGRNRVVLADPALLGRPAAEIMLETERFRRTGS
jgi:diguanylate cyclase (GGDEF)-like protein